MAQSEARKKALRHARGIVKRLSKKGYTIDANFAENLSKMSTRALQYVSRKGLVQSGKAVYAERTKTYFVTLNNKKQAFEQDKLAEVSNDELQWDLIKKVVRHFEEYAFRDVEEFGGSVDAKRQVAENATEVMDYLIEAEAKYADKKPLIEGIKRVFGSISKFSDDLERYILLVYGKYSKDEAEEIRRDFDRKLRDALGV